MKLPGNLWADELVKALIIYGYSINRQKGNHIRLSTTINKEHYTTILNHDPIKIGTVSSIVTDVANHLGKTKEQVAQHLFGR